MYFASLRLSPCGRFNICINCSRRSRTLFLDDPHLIASIHVLERPRWYTTTYAMMEQEGELLLHQQKEAFEKELEVINSNKLQDIEEIIHLSAKRSYLKRGSLHITRNTGVNCTPMCTYQVTWTIAKKNTAFYLHCGCQH